MSIRGRSLIDVSRSATVSARQPALERPRSGDWDSLLRWVEAATERLEVRQGSRGNKWEKAVTFRDLELLGLPSGDGGMNVVPQVQKLGTSNGTLMMRQPDGTSTSMTIEEFSNLIRDTKLYRDLMKSNDDPSRFNGLPEQVRALLLTDLHLIAGQRGADIQRLESRLQTQHESFAYQLTQVTAAVAESSAGVSDTLFSHTNHNRATAGRVLRVTARLDRFTGGAPGTATVEAKMTAVASRATGLEAQYTVKVSAGGAAAGFGLAAVSSGATASSAFIIQASRFAIVPSTYAGGLTTAPPAGNLPFGIDAGTGNVNISGNLLVGGTVTGAKVAARTLTGDHLAVGSITAASAVIGNLAVTTLTIADNAVSSTGYAEAGDTVSLANSGIYQAELTVYGIDGNGQSVRVDFVADAVNGFTSAGGSGAGTDVAYPVEMRFWCISTGEVYYVGPLRRMSSITPPAGSRAYRVDFRGTGGSTIVPSVALRSLYLAGFKK